MSCCEIMKLYDANEDKALREANRAFRFKYVESEPISLVVLLGVFAAIVLLASVVFS